MSSATKSVLTTILLSILALVACGSEPPPTPTPTSSPTPTETPTPVPPTATASPSPIPPTATPRPTDTPVPPTATPEPTRTPIPPTVTPVPTETPIPPTATPVTIAGTPLTRPTTEKITESGTRRYPVLSGISRFETPRIGVVELFVVDELALHSTWRVSDRPDVGGECEVALGKPLVDSERKWDYTRDTTADSIQVDLEPDDLLMFLTDCIVERVPGYVPEKQSVWDTRYISELEHDRYDTEVEIDPHIFNLDPISRADTWLVTKRYDLGGTCFMGIFKRAFGDRKPPLRTQIVEFAAEVRFEDDDESVAFANCTVVRR